MQQTQIGSSMVKLSTHYSTQMTPLHFRRAFWRGEAVSLPTARVWNADFCGL